MCTNKSLVSGRNGFITRCLDCGRFQIGFGTSLINLSYHEFTHFCELSKEQYLQHKNNGFELHKAIHLPTFSLNNQMILCLLELEDLLEMLREANFMIEVETLLQKPVHD